MLKVLHFTHQSLTDIKGKTLDVILLLLLFPPKPTLRVSLGTFEDNILNIRFKIYIWRSHLNLYFDYNTHILEEMCI